MFGMTAEGQAYFIVFCPSRLSPEGRRTEVVRRSCRWSGTFRNNRKFVHVCRTILQEFGLQEAGRSTELSRTGERADETGMKKRRLLL